MTAPRPVDVDLRVLLRSSMRTLRRIGLVAAALALAVAAWSLLAPRRFAARTVVSAVGPTRPGLNGSIPASILMEGLRMGNGGIQATPELVNYLLTSETVLLTVARQPWQSGTLGQAALGSTVEELGAARTLRRMRSHVRVVFSRQTGLLTLTVATRDSAVARAIAQGVVREAQTLFASVASSQAGQFRRAQQQRFDSAAAGLRAAEQALVAFTEGNRVVSDGTRLALERDRLGRRVTSAQQVYDYARNDLEAARAQELEQTPAIATVEALPAELPREDRNPLLQGVLAGLAVVVLGILLLTIRALWTGAAG
jgi:hypothetical protein